MFVLAISTPVIAFAVIGGYLGQAIAKEDAYQHLRVFEDVVNLVLTNYVEPVDITDAMKGAMKGLADGLDPDSAYLTPDLVRAAESDQSAGTADVGLELVRQYYLRVVSARDDSPAARAGLRPGDFIRAIDNRPTRDMSAFEGGRLMRGAPGSTVSLLVIRGNAADPHVVELVRERMSPSAIASRMAADATGYLRVVEFSPDTLPRLREAVDTLAKSGARRYVIDLRGTARGDLDDGVAAARLFVADGTLSIKQTKGDAREIVASNDGDGGVAAPIVLITDPGTSGAAEVFAAALRDNGRARLVGAPTIGRAARQQLVKLPDGSGLFLTHTRYLTPKAEALHEAGLRPDVPVDLPDVEFGAQPPSPDATLARAIEVAGQL
jgi:carboxyl-terminal processing protease